MYRVETHGDIDKLSGNCQAATRLPPDSLLAAVGRIEATGRMQTTFKSADERPEYGHKKGLPTMGSPLAISESTESTQDQRNR